MKKIALLAAGCWAAVEVLALPPEIADVYPNFPGFGPHIITGENFDPAKTRVWTWEPPAVKSIGAGAGGPEAPPELPSRPPEGARRLDPLEELNERWVRDDREREVLVLVFVSSVISIPGNPEVALVLNHRSGDPPARGVFSTGWRTVVTKVERAEAHSGRDVMLIETEVGLASVVCARTTPLWMEKLSWYVWRKRGSPK